MRFRPILILLVLSLAGCQLFNPAPASTPAPVSTPSGNAAEPSRTPATRVPSPYPEGSKPLPPFPTARSGAFAALERVRWQGGAYSGPVVLGSVDLSRLDNPAVLAGLTEDQLAHLSVTEFVILHTQEEQFSSIREQVSKRYGQPYFLTTDAAYHALHQTFDELLKAVEKGQLRPRMIALTQSLFDEVSTSAAALDGTELEEEAMLAAAYLGTALKLFNPQARLGGELEARAGAQIEQIAAGRREKSVLIPGFEDDYSAYVPVGHYAGDPALEAYYRGMTWLGRVHFLLADPEQPSFEPSRAPLIITLALRRARVGGLAAAEEWAVIDDALAFLIGESDDAGPREYAALMDAVYKDAATLTALADGGLWEEFLQRSEELPAPQINSTFARSLLEMESERGWRFMGQRFTLDGFIFQNLISDKVGTQQKPRKLPSGLDVMAALGSMPALEALELAGEAAYTNYPEQMAMLKAMVAAQEEESWLGSFYSAWLYAYQPQVEVKDERFPPFMRNEAWGYKELNSALGSWAELKHDTTLYTKKPEFAGGGGPPASEAAPGYVEPNPEVFYRLAYAARALHAGLQARSLGESLVPVEEGDFIYPYDLTWMFNGVLELAGQFERLGNLAARELAGEPVTSLEDRELIQSCLGPVECKILYMQLMYTLGGTSQWQELPPVAVISAAAGAENEILQVGVGGVDRIYVIVPAGEGYQVAQGGVFSYYEFAQPRSEPLSDAAWGEMLAENPPARPGWAEKLVPSGGSPTDVLTFRSGDVYLVTTAGDRLNVRAQAGRQGRVVKQLAAGDYIQLAGEPVIVAGERWWQVRVPYSEGAPLGYVLEQEEWFERAWGQ